MKIRILTALISTVTLLCAACTPGTYYPFGNNPNVNSSNIPNQPARTITYEPPANDSYSKQKAVGF